MAAGTVIGVGALGAVAGLVGGFIKGSHDAAKKGIEGGGQEWSGLTDFFVEPVVGFIGGGGLGVLGGLAIDAFVK